MNNLKAIYYKKEKVLQLTDNNNHIADFIVDEQDEWFQTKIGKKQFMFNYINGKLGMFEANKFKENSYEVGEFLAEIEVNTK